MGTESICSQLKKMNNASTVPMDLEKQQVVFPLAPDSLPLHSQVVNAKYYIDKAETYCTLMKIASGPFFFIVSRLVIGGLLLYAWHKSIGDASNVSPDNDSRAFTIILFGVHCCFSIAVVIIQTKWPQSTCSNTNNTNTCKESDKEAHLSDHDMLQSVPPSSQNNRRLSSRYHNHTIAGYSHSPSLFHQHQQHLLRKPADLLNQDVLEHVGFPTIPDCALDSTRAHDLWSAYDITELQSIIQVALFCCEVLFWDAVCLMLFLPSSIIGTVSKWVMLVAVFLGSRVFLFLGAVLYARYLSRTVAALSPVVLCAEEKSFSVAVSDERRAAARQGSINDSAALNHISCGFCGEQFFPDDTVRKYDCFGHFAHFHCFEEQVLKRSITNDACEILTCPVCNRNDTTYAAETNRDFLSLQVQLVTFGFPVFFDLMPPMAYSQSQNNVLRSSSQGSRTHVSNFQISPPNNGLHYNPHNGPSPFTLDRAANRVSMRYSGGYSNGNIITHSVVPTLHNVNQISACMSNINTGTSNYNNNHNHNHNNHNSNINMNNNNNHKFPPLPPAPTLDETGETADELEADVR